MSESHLGRIGLIATLSQDAWPDVFVDHANRGLAQVRSTLQAMRFQVVDGGPLARTWTEVAAQAGKLASEKVDALLIFANTWTYANAGVLAAVECPAPIVVWAEATQGRYGIRGGGVLKGSLDEIGACCSLVYGCVDDPETLEEVRTLCVGAATATRLRGLRFGMGGTCSMGMYTALIDASQWSRQFGVAVDGFEQAEVVRRAELVPDDEAQVVLRWMRATHGRIDPPEAVMLHQIKVYLALKQMVRENGYDFLTIKCLPEMPACHTTFCVAHALLNSTADADGPKAPFVCSCEADANGALTMQLLKHATGEATLFADVLQLDRKERILTMSNCGSQTLDYAACAKEVCWQKACIPQMSWKMGGTFPQYIPRPGRMTLARLSRVKGRHVMLIAEGESLVSDPDVYWKQNYACPYVFVRLDGSAETFVKHLRSNHISAAYGSSSRVLEEACRVLEIETIVV